MIPAIRNARGLSGPIAKPETKRVAAKHALAEAEAKVEPCGECEKLRADIVELRKQIGQLVLDNVEAINAMQTVHKTHKQAIVDDIVKPWVKEGIPKSTYYRRQKKDKAK